MLPPPAPAFDLPFEIDEEEEIPDAAAAAFLCAVNNANFDNPFGGGVSASEEGEALDVASERSVVDEETVLKVEVDAEGFPAGAEEADVSAAFARREANNFCIDDIGGAGGDIDADPEVVSFLADFADI